MTAPASLRHRFTRGIGARAIGAGRGLVLAGLLSACATYEGTYAPDCIAYSGDRIKLDGGRFVWDKFTDQVMIDDAGRKIDPFPEYPILGRYRIEEQRVIFDSYMGEELPDMYLRTDENRSWLLTAAESERWQETGTPPDCPLILGGDS